MKTFVKTFRGKISYKRIDKYVDLEIQYDDWQFVKIQVWDIVLH